MPLLPKHHQILNVGSGGVQKQIFKFQQLPMFLKTVLVLRKHPTLSPKSHWLAWCCIWGLSWNHSFQDICPPLTSDCESLSLEHFDASICLSTSCCLNSSVSSVSTQLEMDKQVQTEMLIVTLAISIQKSPRRPCVWRNCGYQNTGSVLERKQNVQVTPLSEPGSLIPGPTYLRECL